MSIIAFIISLGLLIYSFINRKKSKSFSPVILFFALWTFILFLSMLNLYEIIKPSNEAYILIILMLVFFFLGSITDFNALKLKIQSVLKKVNKREGRHIKNSKTNKNSEKRSDLGKVGKTIFYILSVLLIIFTLIDCVIVIQGIIDGVPMWKIRRWGMEVAGSTANPLVARRSFIEDAFRSIILTPFSTLIPPIAAYMFFNSESKKEKYKFFAISVVVLLLSSVAGGGGRLGFIYYFGCFLLAFLISYKSNKISEENKKKYKRLIFIIFAVGFLLVVLYTMFRNGAGKFIKEVYTYFALPPTLLSIWLPEIKNVQPTLGFVSFFGVHSYFFRILETVGLDILVPQIYNTSYQYILNAEIFKNTGYGVGNAFVSPIYYFMIDGGYPFVCFASYCFGLIVSDFYKKFEENVNNKSFIYYALVMYGVFLTFIRMQTAIPSYVISFVFVYFIFSEHTEQLPYKIKNVIKKWKRDREKERENEKIKNRK